MSGETEVLGQVFKMGEESEPVQTALITIAGMTFMIAIKPASKSFLVGRAALSGKWDESQNFEFESLTEHGPPPKALQDALIQAVLDMTGIEMAPCGFPSDGGRS